MLRTCILWVGLFGAVNVQAQQFRVEKVKGNKAVIEFSGTGLTQGRTYGIGAGHASSSLEEGSAGGDRRYIVGGSMNLQFLTYNSSTLNESSKNNLMEVSARFGWNQENYEFGPLLGYSNTETPSTSTSAFTVGGFFDYNFVPNRSGETSVFGATAELTYASVSSTTTASKMGLFAAGFAKWFVFGPSTALRVDAGYGYEKGTYTTFNSTNQGFVVRGGLATYF